MLFNSIEYLFFLPLVFIIYWGLAGRNLRWQNLFVVIASYTFYGWWDWRFLLLIAFTSLCSYTCGLLTQRFGRAICIFNIAINLGILGLYKYYDFFVGSLVEGLSLLGWQMDWHSLNWVLPVGISFYTFQALSYTIDVYKQKISPTRDLVAFLAFISFFPQLVAGPIERATSLLPQFTRARHFDTELASDGLRQILWGLFKKMVVADNCATIVNYVFADYQHQTGLALLIGAVYFAFQIYGDFSGYSDIAIGTGKLFGVRLMTNFRVPYFSRDIAEFWRRWHISLTTWFRDYIYIPLGGSRCTTPLVIRNTFVIFLVSGLWHGANWTFIAWGLFHALLFVPMLLSHRNRKHTDTVANGRWLPTIGEALQMVATFALVVLGWIFFRSHTISDAVSYIYYIFAHWGVGELLGKRYLVGCLLMLVIEWVQRNKQHGLEFSHDGWLMRHTWARWCLYLAFSIYTLAAAGMQGEFIYFQF